MEWIEFEKEASEILKAEFDDVVWLSNINGKSIYDFKCFKNGKEYYGDAKFRRNLRGKLSIPYKQKDADFIIAKINGKIIIIWKEEFKNKLLIKNLFPKNCKDKLIQTKNGIKTVLKRIVKKFGAGAHISLPKKYIGKEVEIYIKEEIQGIEEKENEK